MKRSVPFLVLGLVPAFAAGFFTHALYQRWTVPEPDVRAVGAALPEPPVGAVPTQSHRVTFVPLSGDKPPPSGELPLIEARDVKRIRGLAGSSARIRGRVFRVGHSTKSNTYFLNFGPSREALTAVIFASAAEAFEQEKLPPKAYQGREVEVAGVIKDHPQYGLELILEKPAQIRILN